MLEKQRVAGRLAADVGGDDEEQKQEEQDRPSTFAGAEIEQSFE